MAGGHLHFGWSEGSRPSNAECKEMVKSLDTILGVYCVALFHKYDDKRRRALYGRAGEYRKPPHGLEYRVLSNAWLIHPVYAHLVFEIGRRAINMAGMVDLLWQASEEEVRDCINNCDLRLAKKLLMRNAVMMKALLQNITGYEEGAERLFKLAFDGADSVLDTKRTLEDRWNINGTWVSHSDGKGKNIATALPMLLKNQMLG
jgi:Phage phiEco32-like COOH.NH2 ligase-type 2